LRCSLDSAERPPVRKAFRALFSGDCLDGLARGGLERAGLLFAGTRGRRRHLQELRLARDLAVDRLDLGEQRVELRGFAAGMRLSAGNLSLSSLAALAFASRWARSCCSFVMTVASWRCRGFDRMRRFVAPALPDF
jgi:hypothetical protein